MDIIKWIYFNCPKDHAWIIYHNLKDILHNSKYTQSKPNQIPSLTSSDEILYIHSSIVTENKLYCLLETNNGIYSIHNTKKIITPNNHTTNKLIMDETTDDHQTMDEITDDHQVMDETIDETTDDHQTMDEITDDHQVMDETIDEITDDHQVMDEITDDHQVMDETMKDETMKDKTTNEEMKDEEMKDEEMKDEEMKDEVVVYSTIQYYPNIEIFMKHASKKTLRYLQIKRKKNMKLTTEQLKSRSILPYCFTKIKDRLKLLEYTSSEGELNLRYNFTVTADDLLHFNPSNRINKMTLHTTYKINHLRWCDSNWTKNLYRVNIINMFQFNNQTIEYLTIKLPNIRELYVHTCPQVNIRCLLNILNNNKIEVLCLDNSRMICQPNEYSGLISEEEWNIIKNTSLKKLLINSTNLSLDIIDYLRTYCYELRELIIDSDIFTKVHKSIVSLGDKSRPLSISSNKRKRLNLGKDFLMTNLLKDKFQEPFSNCMLEVINRIQKEENEQT